MPFQSFFFFQAEDGIRDRSPSRGLGDVYKRQVPFPTAVGPARTTNRRLGAVGLSEDVNGAGQDCSKRSIRAAIWLLPRPRTRRVSEMPNSSMIWRARTRPTPGIDSSNA